ARSTPWFNLVAHRRIPAGAPVVYMAEDVSFPICRARSLVVQHGVWWDGELNALELRAAELMVRRAVRRSRGLICVDTNFANWLRARWPGTQWDHKLHLIPNFLDARTFGPPPEVPAAARGGRVTICFPRRSEPRRGLHLMADAAPQLLARFPQVDIRFVVGSGNHTDALRRRLADAACPASRCSIEVHGFDDMRSVYRESQIVTIPTVCGEGTSLAAIEAMYCGCAVVGTWVGGLADLLWHEQNALVIAPDAAQLTAACARLVEDPLLRVRLGSRALADAPARFAIERWQYSVGAVLEQALGLGVAR
ncbi:MAG: glycosyltransferase family 4 protein, partial [Planctomycetes bacterium]|nr:glycosyltransferase family 4 protein [Planctomycetota bacterium]